jgi:hypothetical protein
MKNIYHNQEKTLLNKKLFLSCNQSINMIKLTLKRDSDLLASSKNHLTSTKEPSFSTKINVNSSIKQ